jgi:hypothetical protein
MKRTPLGAVTVLSVAALFVGGHGCEPVRHVPGDVLGRHSSEDDPLPCPASGCVAGTIETCFDAKDDDCDGLVDEGCGLPVGILQILMAWDVPDANVDLEVTDPNGEVAGVGRPTTLGLVRDRDCPGEEAACGGQNVEVVTLEAGAVPSGRFLVRVVRRSPISPGNRLVVRLGGHLARSPLGAVLSLLPEERVRELSLEQLIVPRNCATLSGS